MNRAAGRDEKRSRPGDGEKEEREKSPAEEKPNGNEPGDGVGRSRVDRSIKIAGVPAADIIRLAWARPIRNP